MVGGSSLSSTPSKRTDSDKEKTKLRERRRRAITTNIFQGLRRYGGYHLSTRADINEVLRELAKEAGWVVEPDGTTYRLKLVNRCLTCGATPNGSAAATPASTTSTVFCGGGGECSTTASPRRTEPSVLTSGGKNNSGGSKSNANNYGGDVDIPLAFYMYGGLAIHQRSTATAAVVREGAVMALSSQEQQVQVASASNRNTPVGSPSQLTK